MALAATGCPNQCVGARVRVRFSGPSRNSEVFLGEPVGQSWLQLAELAPRVCVCPRPSGLSVRSARRAPACAPIRWSASRPRFRDAVCRNTASPMSSTSGRVVLDPSRVAAQIVSGIGFIGGGLIFVRKDIVRGLTTAATVWLTAAVGMACGAGLPILAVAVTGGHFVVVIAFPARSSGGCPSRAGRRRRCRISYQERSRRLARGSRRLHSAASSQSAACKLSMSRHAVEVNRARKPARGVGPDGRIIRGKPRKILADAAPAPGIVTLLIEVRGSRSVAKLAARLSEIAGVTSVRAGDANLAYD